MFALPALLSLHDEGNLILDRDSIALCVRENTKTLAALIWRKIAELFRGGNSLP
jgi:hypothetical protein